MKKRAMDARRRVILLASLVATAAVLAAVPAGAQAFYWENYCGVVLNPGTQTCFTSGLHSFESNSADYPGPWQHNVNVCGYMWNNATQQIRGGVIHCDYDYSGWYYNPTYNPTYNGRVYLNAVNCCPHTVNGYARTTN